MIAIPALILLGGLAFIVVMIVRGRRASKRAKNTVSGLLYIHPDHGGGHRLMLNNASLSKPGLQAYWYRPNWLSPEIPFFFFYENRVETKVAAEPERFECSCGYKAEDGRRLQAHRMWNKSRKTERTEWDAKHQKVEMPPAAPMKTVTTYEVVPFDVDSQSPSILTTYGLFDLNNWDCQKAFLTVKKGWQSAVQMGASIVLAVACLVVAFVVASEMRKDNSATEIVKPQSIETRYTK